MQPQESREWVSAQVKAWQPTERERAWEKIGWAESLVEARKLAQQHRRLLFVFTLDGRMQVGRC